MCCLCSASRTLMEIQIHLDSSCIAHLCFADIMLFYKLKACGNPPSSKSISAIFPTAFAHSVSPRHILEILIMFQTFHYYCVCYDDLWSAVFDVTIVAVLRHYKLHPCKTANSINPRCVCPDCSSYQSSSHLSPSPGASYSPRHNNIAIRPINNPVKAIKCSSERKSLMSHFKSEGRND